jgi:hypothetical protein
VAVVVAAPVTPAKPTPAPHSGRYRLSERRATLIGLAVMILGASVLVLQALHQSATRSDAGDQPAAPLAAGIPTPVPPVAAVPSPAEPQAALAALPEAQAVARPPGTITFDWDTMTVNEAQSLVAIPLKRLRSTRGAVAVAWNIEGGTAEPGVDYQAVGGNVVRFIDGQPMRSIFIALTERNAATATRRPRTLVVALRRMAGGVAVGPVTRTTVTLARDPVSSVHQQDGR